MSKPKTWAAIASASFMAGAASTSLIDGIASGTAKADPAQYSVEAELPTDGAAMLEGLVDVHFCPLAPSFPDCRAAKNATKVSFTRNETRHWGAYVEFSSQ